MSEQIFTLIAQLRTEVGAIGKNQKNQAQNYKFRGIDDIYNAMSKGLEKTGVFCTPEVVKYMRGERDRVKKGELVGIWVNVEITMKYTFYAPDGSNVAVVTVGEAMDTGDKATNKAMAAAHKYALIQLFCLPTEDQIDTENQSPEPGPSPKAKPSKPDLEANKPPGDARKELGDLIMEFAQDDTTKAKALCEKITGFPSPKGLAPVAAGPILSKILEQAKGGVDIWEYYMKKGE